jgi:hypothetical protein
MGSWFASRAAWLRAGDAFHGPPFFWRKPDRSRHEEAISTSSSANEVNMSTLVVGRQARISWAVSIPQPSPSRTSLLGQRSIEGVEVLGGDLGNAPGSQGEDDLVLGHPAIAPQRRTLQPFARSLLQAPFQQLAEPVGACLETTAAGLHGQLSPPYIRLPGRALEHQAALEATPGERVAPTVDPQLTGYPACVPCGSFLASRLLSVLPIGEIFVRYW